MEKFANKILSVLFGFSSASKAEISEAEEKAKEAVAVYESVVMGKII